MDASAVTDRRRPTLTAAATPPRSFALKAESGGNGGDLHECHQSSLETQNFSNSEHLANGVSCTSCHSPHSSTDVNFCW